MEPDSDPEASPSPSKRRKTLTLTQSPPSSSSSKGKEKMEPDESEAKVCGICFSEGEKSNRGVIDSCAHHFCFVCIMEWAKHESRCPLCKQRFKTILRKPTHGGLLLPERVVNVPVRNQVWHPLGIQTDEIPDPFAEVKCTECQSSCDEHLLLLCDLCDSASHTYCVGLGNTVPEGNWYCQDCTASRNEHYDSDPEAGLENPNTSEVAELDVYDSEDDLENLNTFAVAESYISEDDLESPFLSEASDSDDSITEIECESASQNPRRSARRNVSRDSNSSARETAAQNANKARTTSRRRTASRKANSSARRTASRKANRSTRRKTSRSANRSTGRTASRNVNRSTGRTSSSLVRLPSQVPLRGINAQTLVSDSSVRTLSQCRNVHNRIQVLRSNWNAFRSGSFTFSTEPPNSDRKNNMENKRPGIYDNSSKPQASSSIPSGQITIKENGSDDQNAKNPYDVNRAWKMLDIAKSVQRAREASQSSHQISSHKPDDKGLLKAPSITNPSVPVNKNVPLQPKDRGGFPPEKNNAHRSVEILHQKSPKVEGGLPNKGSLKSSYCQRFPTNPSGHSEVPSVKQTHILDRAVRCSENTSGGNTAVTNMDGRGGNASASQTEPLPKASNISYSRPEQCESQPERGESSHFKEGVSDRNHGKLVGRKDDVAKCEVQSLVKLNLKLLSRDKPLDVNVFKEVARLATHTILAACGLEHKLSNVRPYSGSICRHNDQTKKLRMSNLLPTSCRECFYAFVKTVVNSIMIEELKKQH